ncbi:hypothetical protein ACFVWF_33375 [Rhodococcus qingshengii]|uniref:hypothetical protein n=1 Tax=Rhodococcus qingshengii TaxID=334542 RepID=UPI0036DE8E2C
MTETPAPDEGWSPPPDEGQAGMVLLPNGWWGFRYKAGVRPLIVEKPPGARCTAGHVRRVRSSGSLILRGLEIAFHLGGRHVPSLLEGSAGRAPARPPNQGTPRPRSPPDFGHDAQVIEPLGDSPGRGARSFVSDALRLDFAEECAPSPLDHTPETIAALLAACAAGTAAVVAVAPAASVSGDDLPGRVDRQLLRLAQ